MQIMLATDDLRETEMSFLISLFYPKLCFEETAH